MSKKDTSALHGIPKRKCGTCGNPAEYTVVPQHVWDREDGVSVEIAEARLLLCDQCGIYPADDIEKSRWERLARQWEIDSDVSLSGIVCQRCGSPAESVGEFVIIGWDEELQMCGECYEQFQKETAMGVSETDSVDLPEV